MRNLKIIGLFVIAMSLFACGETKSSDDEKDSSTEMIEEKPKADMKGMEKVDLSEYDIAATMYVPDASKGKRDIVATEWGSVQISSGDKFGIEIIPSGMSIAEKKAELNNASVYSIEIINQESNKLVYKKSINGTAIEPEVHFFMNVDINGELYEIKSMNKNYSEKSIKKMIVSAESLKAKNAS